MQKFKLWYHSLKPRERLIVVGGGTLAVLVAIYTLGLAPFYRSLDTTAERVARKQGDLAWLQSVTPEIQVLGANAPPPVAASGESLVVLIDRAARECGLGESLTGQTPNGDSGIRVRLEGAAFDVLVMCLGNLERVHAVHIETAQFDRTAKPGLVNASLVFNRAAG